MDIAKAGLVVGITLIVVLLLNVAIFVSFSKRKHDIQQVELLRKAASRARSPWEPEDKALEELARLVTDLKKDPPKEGAVEGD